VDCFEITDCDIKAESRWATLCAHAFTEQGVAMLSSVLGSERAIAAILSAIRQLMDPPA
jgi:hypothetical protein